MADVEHPQTTVGGFAVQTEVYTGPLELLIDLIEKRKLLINDISLAAVTDDYMRYVAMLEEKNLRETTQFVLLASTLLLIKSKSLLPVLELTDEEEENVADLENRLKLYQIYRNAGKMLETVFAKRMAYPKDFIPLAEPLFITDRYTTTDSLQTAMREVLTKLPKKEVKPKVRVRTVVSLEEMIDRLRHRIEQQFKLTFKDFTGDATERNIVIVGFLAVLEMVKQGTVMVRQEHRYHDFAIEREHNKTPQYY